jgi:O-succinylbenzoic acid--CoA ligase
MAELILLDMPPGELLVGLLQAAWEDGNAVAVLDRRLTGPSRERAIAALRPTYLVSAEQPRPVRVPGGSPLDDGDALVITTSGSTGQPKAVVHTHEGLRASALAASGALGVDPATDHWLACLPLAHIGGLAVVIRALVTGTRLTVLPRFDAEAVSGAARDGATLTALVSTALDQVDSALFRRVLLGAGPPGRDLPANVVSTYGLTETGSGVVYDGFPLRGVEVTIASDGEICLRAPMLARCYRDGTPLVGDDGWFHTRDRGEMDPSYGLRVFGRMSEMINTGGEKVWPTEIEAVLARHPGVADVAVFGRPDPKWGQRVVAAIVARSTPTPSLAEVAEFVRSELPPWCVPKELELRDSLPRTALGKLQRHLLR